MTNVYTILTVAIISPLYTGTGRVTETNDHHYRREKCVNCSRKNRNLWEGKVQFEEVAHSKERNVNELITHAFLLQEEEQKKKQQQPPEIGCNKFATIVK